MFYLAGLISECKSAGVRENSLTNYVKAYACCALVMFPAALLVLPLYCSPCLCYWSLSEKLLVSIKETVSLCQDLSQCEPVILLTHMFIYLPCTSAYYHFPVMSPTVNEHVASYSVASLACESLWCVTLFGGRFITFHCQVIMRHFQFSMSRFGVQFKWLT